MAATATQGLTAKGIILSIGVAGAPETFVPVMRIKQSSFSGITVKYDDVSNLDSPVLAPTNEVTVEEAIPVTVSPGTWTSSGVYVATDAGQLAMQAAFYSQALTDFKIAYPLPTGKTTAATTTFSGYVSELPISDLDFSKTMTIKFTVKLNTVPAITAAS